MLGKGGCIRKANVWMIFLGVVKVRRCPSAILFFQRSDVTMYSFNAKSSDSQKDSQEMGILTACYRF